MKFFIDTEFIEDGKTIDLISIGVVAEDGRELYLQNAECNFDKASDWVVRNVLPSLVHYDMGRRYRTCSAGHIEYGRIIRSACSSTCAWATRNEIANNLIEFCGDKPEFWGYYADYDWVVICQLFGTMMNLPQDWPMYCNDIKQLAVEKGNPDLHILCDDNDEHHALADAKWNKRAYDVLNKQ